MRRGPGGDVRRYALFPAEQTSHRAGIADEAAPGS